MSGGSVIQSCLRLSFFSDKVFYEGLVKLERVGVILCLKQAFMQNQEELNNDKEYVNDINVAITKNTNKH